MSKHDDLNEKLGKQDVYLINDFEEWAMMIPKDGGEMYPCKFKGDKLYKIKFSTNLACETLMRSQEISKEEFEKY